MENSNLRTIPIHRKPPANDTQPGPLRFTIPDDVLACAAKRTRAGLVRTHTDHARPDRFETVSVMIAGDTFPRRATVMCAPPGHPECLIRYQYQDGAPGCPMAAWVHLTQITYPNRNAQCGVV